MNFLGGEIAKLKRKAPQTDEKFIRRSEIEARREQEYRKDQEKIRADRENRESEKRRKIIEQEEDKRKRRENQAAGLILKQESEVDLANTQKALVELKQPIRLFGESTQDIYQRLQKLRVRQEREANSTSAILREVYSDPPDADLPSPQSVDIPPIRTVWPEGSEGEGNDEERQKLSTNLYLLFRAYINSWSMHVFQAHPSPIGDSANNLGQETPDTQLFKQAREHLSRLLIRLKVNTLPKDMLKNLTNVAKSLQKGDYTAANHAYLQMSIGKATWPVGVSMVGIHERAQRERQHKELDSAHILSDEMTRQWLQSLKRLITHLEHVGAK